MILGSNEQGAGNLYLGIYHGVVVDRKDPQSLYRIRAVLPGFIEPSTAWALPIGTMGGGSPQRGGWVVPKEGADVVVQFLGGNIERPVYQCAWWGKPEAGSEMPDAVKDLDKDAAPDVQTFQAGRFAITLDERVGQEKFTIEDLTTGDSFQWDLAKAKVMLDISTAIFLKSKGVVDIDALELHLNGRLVTTSPKGI